MTIQYRLTLTWDVLKFYNRCSLYIKEQWLTLTWDVLKCYNLLTVP